MRELWVLTRTMLRSTFGTSAFRWRYIKRKERLWEPVVITCSIGSAVAVFGYGLYSASSTLTLAGAMLGQPELVLGLAAVSAQALTFLLGLFMVISTFYFSREMKILMPLPLEAGTIITAKFLTVLCGQYLTLAPLFFPVILGYSRHVTFGVGKALISVLVLLLLPVLPLAAASILAVLLMRAINRRHRDALMVVFSLLFIVSIIALQAILAQGTTGDPLQHMLKLIETRYGLLRAATRGFPPPFWAALAIHEWPDPRALVYLLYTIVASAGATKVLALTGQRLFFKGLEGGDETGGGRVSRQNAGDGILKAPRTPKSALVQREWALFMRTPLWVLNGLAPAIIVPVALLMPLVTSGRYARLLADLAASPVNQLRIGLGVAAMLIFTGCLNTTASTSVSREGSRLWISRIIPVSAEVQVSAKLDVAVRITTLAALPPVAAYALLLRPPAIHVVMPLAIGILGSVVGLAFGLALDVARPMLRWDNPQEPVKRNLNVLAPMIVAFLYFVGGSSALSRMLEAGLGADAIYMLFFTISAVLAVASWFLVRVSAVGAYARLEA